MTGHFYHGTRTELKAGELIEPAKTGYVYLTANLDAAIWEAELDDGVGAGRVYVVDPVGRIEDASDNLSPGRPAMSLRSREALRVTAEITDWPGHSAEAIEAMKKGLERLERLGFEPIDD